MLEYLLVGMTILVITMIVGPMIRRRKLRDGRTPTAVWVVVALLMVLTIALSIYSLSQPR